MTRRELAAAGISDPQLRSDYEHCRALAAHHGRTYFLATRLLPIDRRPAVHALYGFARTADQIVDELPAERPVADRARALEDLAGQLPLGARSTEPTVRAVADTAARYDLDPTLFRDFLTAMRTDLTVTEYETYADLEAYMHGSAAVIGLQMLPILGTVGPAEAAAPYAARLGVAFQLTNFIRDVGEDLRRGRIYLPQESLRRFGIDRARLERRQVDAPIRAWLAAEIARTRALYEQARPGLEMLAPRSQSGLRTAFTLYREILAAVERADYQVFGPRISVPLRRRIPLAAGAALLTGRRRRVRAAPRSTA